MSGRIGIWTVALASFVCAGCDALSERPGHDFAMRVLDEEPIEAVGRIYVPVRFAVDGCGAFDLALEEGSGTRRPVSYTAQPDGTFVAAVPAAWLQDQDACTGGFQGAMYRHDPGTLVTSCRDADRDAKAAFSFVNYFSYSYYGADGDVRAVFPSNVPGRPAWIATSAYGGEVDALRGVLTGEWAPALNPAAYRNVLVRPRMVRSGNRVFATLGCETSPQCPQISIGAGETRPGERLAELDVNTWTQVPRAIAHVSTNVVDMAFAEDGALVVVTDTSLGFDPYVSGTGTRWGETMVWRVLPAPEGSVGVVENEATVIARFTRETVATRLTKTASGALAFATVAAPVDSTDVMVNLHVTDGSTVTTSYTRSMRTRGCFTDGFGLTSFDNAGVFLSPDASSLVLPVCYQHPIASHYLWVDPADPDAEPEPFDRLPLFFQPSETRSLVNHYTSYVHGGSAWLPDAVALWSGGDILSGVARGDSAVHVFDAASPHAFRWEYVVEALPGATADPALVGVLAVGDHLVLTTTTGVRILDATGALVGGADPFPCGAKTTATAEQIAPTIVAVGVGDVMIRFDLTQVGPVPDP